MTTPTLSPPAVDPEGDYRDALAALEAARLAYDRAKRVSDVLRDHAHAANQEAQDAARRADQAADRVRRCNIARSAADLGVTTEFLAYEYRLRS